MQKKYTIIFLVCCAVDFVIVFYFCCCCPLFLIEIILKNHTITLGNLYTRKKNNKQKSALRKWMVRITQNKNYIEYIEKFIYNVRIRDKNMKHLK